MDLLEKCLVLKFHKDCLAQSGEGSVGALGWETTESQQKRFEALAGIANLSNTTVLDLGCGYGDLKAFLDERYAGVRYTGIDFMPEFIERAKQRFSGNSTAQFLRQDFTAMDIPGADYVFGSGIFCYPTQQPDYYQGLIDRMLRSARKGIAFNMLNAADFPEGLYLKAHDMESMYRYCRTLSNRVELRTGYLAGDFTVYIYKNQWG
jgi:trans-aconitate methyltransferase